MRSPAGWPKRKRDWVGLRVISCRPLSNLGLKFPVGTKGTITSGGPTMRVTFDPCNHCGIQGRISGVSPSDFTRIPDAEVKFE